MQLNGKKFQPALLLQLVFSTIFGYFVDGAKFILGDFANPTYVGQLIMLAGSVLLIGFSLVLYIDVQIAPPCLRRGWWGAVLSLVFLGKLVGIREGTVVTALLAGRVMGILRVYISSWIRKICFEE